MLSTSIRMETLTTAQAAEQLGVDQETVRQMIRSGQLMGAEKHGNRWRIAAWSVADYISARDSHCVPVSAA